MNFPYGKIVKELPEGFVPPEAWPEYGHISDPVPICRRELISEDPLGIRWCLWPLCFEEYVGDAEPDIKKSGGSNLAYNRIALWRRIRRADAPRGWHKGLPVIFRVDGYQLLDNSEDFTKRWNKKARREVRLWQEQYYQKTHTIEDISFEEYSAAYKKSLVAQRMGLDRLHFMESKLKVPIAKENIRLWGVRDKKTGQIVAGTGVVFAPSHASSTHLVPFIQKEARHIYAATGLMHHWFEESRRRGMPLVMTTNFWHPGKSKSWKGFSEFKSHFGFTYATYPPVLWRFVRGKIF